MIHPRIFVSLVSLFICILFASEKVNAQDKLLVIDLENQTTGSVNSPLLFGHNLEVTRRGFWSGLSAQMVANRKFAATQHGLPKKIGESSEKMSIRLVMQPGELIAISLF